MIRLAEIKEAFLHLLFPHVCSGCGTDGLNRDSELCLRCLASMPETSFERHAGNPVEKLFYGRLPLQAASAQFYFTRESLMQHLVHQFKYKGNRRLGLQLGILMGEQLRQSGRFAANALIPLPLFPAKEKRRGFNQAGILCEGMSAVMHIPVLEQAVIRSQFTETQTKKGRIERWKNMEGKFLVPNPAILQHKQLLLVDDVVTTGATLEACGNEILKTGNACLSIATLCMASR